MILPSYGILKEAVNRSRADEYLAEILNKGLSVYENHFGQCYICQKTAKQIINSRIDNFATNRQIANTFLFLNKYNLDKDYFDNRIGYRQSDGKGSAFRIDRAGKT